MEWKHASLPYRISDNKELLELDTIYHLLQTSYWAAKRSRETVAKSIEHSLCFGLYGEGGQVGFMRVVTDYATFSWICDVIIDPRHRGQGLAKWMMQVLGEHPAVRHTYMILATRDAHGLYEQFGFQRREILDKRPVNS
ncbi:GNAT family N-acetyltransferase [Laceyella sacchari]|uniref:GNAT family N-acetyltransferase n=1 Tax=Laceyella sacchari TaxID=37482 RepID=A0ABY5U4Q1_LACSH|nr:GNAT family N-acetyltransferase [Laceyella sacchari]TCW40995.1 ribosomal protein S18 acetylase RimI-like enzyme [Laceyella sacchari]UWE04598.1 GNAT family N-acetyltransferase [Laceyella sacchari]